MRCIGLSSLSVVLLLWHHLPCEAFRIVGGNFADKNQFPHQVALLKEQHKLHCGGSVVSRSWVVTAAHCLLNNGKPYPVQTFTVFAGAVDLNDLNGQRLTVKKLYPHEGFGNAFNDIGLVETVEQFLFGENVKPIALRKTQLPDGTELVISGYGRTGSGEPTSDRLRFTSVRSIPLKECTDRVGITYHGIICVEASKPGEHGLCNGDSGGPAVFNNELVGVANWVFIACGNDPGGFANVTNFVGWIEQHLQQ